MGNTQNEPRIILLPSLRLGCSNLSHLSFIRRGFHPNPRPFPSPGEGMQPPASARSVTKVSATHQRVAGRFLTQQSCDYLCSLRSPQCENPSNFGSCCDYLCSLRSPQCDNPSNFGSFCDCLCGLLAFAPTLPRRILSSARSGKVRLSERKVLLLFGHFSICRKGKCTFSFINFHFF